MHDVGVGWAAGEGSRASAQVGYRIHDGDGGTRSGGGIG
jgi:hypothetical protein